MKGLKNGLQPTTLTLEASLLWPQPQKTAGPLPVPCLQHVELLGCCLGGEGLSSLFWPFFAPPLASDPVCVGKNLPTCGSLARRGAQLRPTTTYHGVSKQSTSAVARTDQHAFKLFTEHYVASCVSFRSFSSCVCKGCVNGGRSRCQCIVMCLCLCLRLRLCLSPVSEYLLIITATPPPLPLTCLLLSRLFSFSHIPYSILHTPIQSLYF